jgi:hypothetical protein
MKATFHGGPLDGVEIELARTIDKLLILDDDGNATRYECDIIECLDEYASGDTTPDCHLHVVSLEECFDEELIESLRAKP